MKCRLSEDYKYYYNLPHHFTAQVGILIMLQNFISHVNLSMAFTNQVEEFEGVVLSYDEFTICLANAIRRYAESSVFKRVWVEPSWFSG